MTKRGSEGSPTIKPLKNVQAFSQLMDKVMSRPAGLPGIVTFHGYSGYGKTFSATYAAHTHRAYYLEMGYSWSQTRFIDALGQAVGLPSKSGTIATKVERIINHLAGSERPIIIDEADYLFSRKMHELVREIHDNTQLPVALLGEELLPQKISDLSERFQNRVFDYCPAFAIDETDSWHLVDLMCPGIKIADDLFSAIFTLAQGRARRLCVNLAHITETARLTSKKTMTLADWGEREFFTGIPPVVRAA